jgi:hypothetical protein
MQIRLQSVALALTSLLLLLMAGCTDSSDEVRQYLNLKDRESVNRFRALTPDKKIDVYLRSLRATKPSNYVLAYLIAEGDEDVLPSLVQAFEKEKDSQQIQDLLFLTKVVCRKRQCTADKKLIEACTKAVDSLPQNMKAEATEVLHQIDGKK